MTVPNQPRLLELTQCGVSIWLDDLDRGRLISGNLAELIREWSIRGVTTNPAIFEQALRNAREAYADELRSCAADGLDAEQSVRRLTTHDVRQACEMFLPLWHSSDGLDGRVSIEVDPRLAHDVPGTVAQAEDLWAEVDRPNAMIKIPATAAGLQAIEAVIGAGISVNVTLIFSPERYTQVLAAYANGLRRALAAGVPLAGIRSVASVFVSRVDTAVNPLLDAVNSRAAQSLRGRCAVANAQVVWGRYRRWLACEEWAELAASGAHPQRPLWASTGVKDSALPDTLYVTSLVGEGCVNTMPEGTLRAVADHGVIAGSPLADDDTVILAEQVLADLQALGIDLDQVYDDLERSGVAAFIAAWERLLATTQQALHGDDAAR